MAVLVTGGAGFIGSHIVDKLIERGYDVCIVDNLLSGNVCNINPKAKFYQLDIRDNLEKVFEENKIEYCIHQAAQVSVAKSMEDAYLDCSINVLGTVNLLDYCAKYKVKKFIFASSAAVYGEPEYIPIDENHPLRPESFYGLSKLTSEEYIKMFAHNFNFEYIIFRYSNVYGPRQDPFGEGGVVSIFCERMQSSKDVIIFGDGTQTRDFIYVEDVAEANCVALETSVSGTFNLSTGKNVSVNELFEILSGLTGYKKSPVYQPKRPGDIAHSCLSNNLLKSVLGFSPQFSLLEGLKKTVEYFIDRSV
ncbi:NAD-dependent epimerase/dehydratase family protein [Caldicellulosiruptor acetigenus]|uniref:NAD-dependent epimerase/dehydratase family protein n=1 Tax=Caldicellulosiruptor acetigenus TaxID=301953 RepID=UPI0003FFDC45|nr:NAD-dependent epimerase/dehydratase family protein [Caldicellulosiruptor acetigenus]WAM35266.1 NAD-dependent epimerase/dehydratase family protein [Caldicellulosiruptor acetigenus]